MARPKTPEAEVVDVEMNTEAFAHSHDALNTLSELHAGYSDGRDYLNKRIGVVETAAMFEKFSKTLGISELVNIKQNKLYRECSGMKFQNGLGFSTGTWEDFCKIIGQSVVKVDADIANFKVFGEEALEVMQNMGIGYRQLSQFRRIDGDEKIMLIAAAKDGDKETLLDLAETLISKHTKEKEALTEQQTLAKSTIDNLRGDLTARDELVGKLTTRLNGQPLIAPTPDTIANEFVKTAHEAEATACAWIEGYFRQAVENLQAHDAEHGSNHNAVLAGFVARIAESLRLVRITYNIPELDTDPLLDPANWDAPISPELRAQIDANKPTARQFTGRYHADGSMIFKDELEQDLGVNHGAA